MKLFASDLDGTLLDRNFCISSVNVQAIHRLMEAGYLFSIATGRIYHDAATICRNHGLSPYVIASNGACIYDTEGSQIYGRWIAYSDLKELMQYLDEIEVCYALGGSLDYAASRQWRSVLDQEFARLRGRGICIPEEKISFVKYEMTTQNGFCERNLAEEVDAGNLTCFSVSVITYDEEQIQRIEEFLKNHTSLTSTVAGSHSMEIMRKDGTKGNALKYLASFLNINQKDVTAIGDSFNDLSMLRFAGTSIAMGNSREEIKGACTFTTTDCRDNGFADAVERLLGPV